MIVVELAGEPGVGKSSIAPLLAKKLRDEFGEGVIAALPERDRPRQQRHWTRFKRWSWLLSHPRIYCAAHRLNSLGDRLTSYSNLVRNFSVMGVAHQLAQTGYKVVLVDQGVLRTAMEAKHVCEIPDELLPNLVLQLVADPVTLELRRINRSKIKHVRFSAGLRLEKAGVVRQRLKSLPANELRVALQRFGDRYCDPSLTVAEIEEVVKTEISAADKEVLSGARYRCSPEVCAAFVNRGVQWQQIDNSRPDRMTYALGQCVETIVARLSSGSKYFQTH